MDRRALFGAWCPPDARWSSWAKPTPFAPMDDLLVENGTAPGLPTPEPGPDELTPSIGRADGTTAVVVDLPGARSVAAGLALAGLGYRPVPLFNACHLDAPPPVVPVRPIMDALIRSGPALLSLKLPDDAPPAFLLDADRLGPAGLPVPPPPDRFDNRSVVFATDVPSARRLAEHGIDRVAVVVEPGRDLGIDLAELLQRWSKGGLGLLDVRPGRPGPHPPLVLPTAAGRPFATTRRIAWAWLRLRPNPFGGFGRPPLPEGGSAPG